MSLEEHHAYCMFISIEILSLKMMNSDVHSMTSRVFMGSMTLWGFADLQTSLQISLTRGSKGCASALKIHTRTYGSCAEKYYTSIFLRLEATPR